MDISCKKFGFFEWDFFLWWNLLIKSQNWCSIQLGDVIFNSCFGFKNSQIIKLMSTARFLVRVSQLSESRDREYNCRSPWAGRILRGILSDIVNIPAVPNKLVSLNNFFLCCCCHYKLFGGIFFLLTAHKFGAVAAEVICFECHRIFIQSKLTRKQLRKNIP